MGTLAMRILLCGLLTICFISTCAAGSLDKLNQVDLIEFDAKTSQAQLVVLLDEDRINTRGAVRALYKKFNNYQDFIDSGQVLAAAPNASKTLRPKVVVFAPKEATEAELQNLAGLKLAASKVGAEVEVRSHVPGVKRKPVVIERSLKKNGV